MTDYIKGAYEYFSGEGSRDEVAVKALDDKTLQVELKQPTAYFLNLVSWFTYMPCREDMSSTGEGWEKDPAKCVSNGAFMLEEYKVGSHILLKKNPNFWNANNVNLAGVRILFISDATTSLQAMSRRNQRHLHPARRGDSPPAGRRIPTSPASPPWATATSSSTWTPTW